MYIIALSSVALLITACAYTSSNSDQLAEGVSSDFYSKMGGFDYQRIPLFPPYEAMKINKKSWSIKLHTNSIRYQPSINDIVQIGVADDLILTYSMDSLLEGVAVKEAWFVIVPSKRIEKGFSDFGSMRSFVEELGVTLPNLQNADEQYQIFSTRESLDWFPDQP